ncbi:MAG: AAA15 family ATPase/GTPase [Dasania sp.]|jgi:AAA15 family ATPase/GTPase
MSQYKLKFNSEYRSIKKGFEVINPDQDDMLPQFTLITGENGAGKTHLLSAIRYDANPNQKDNFDTGIQAIKNN